jgi:UDP-3-O-acyl N-acetylglucosamine deacetylase
MSVCLSHQKTIRTPIRLKGKGIHRGEDASLSFEPADVNTGIVFSQNGADAISLRLSGKALIEGQKASRRSTLQGPFLVETVEHLVSCCFGLGVTNLKIHVTGPELPVLDGSAKDFLKAFRQAGIQEQNAASEIYSIREPIFLSENKSIICVLPAKDFRITYTLDYPHPQLKGQTVSFGINEQIYEREIAPARTFCLETEANRLRKEGYGKGADTQNTLVMGDNGPLQNRLRFPDECARHKVLDLLGDLGVLGYELRGHFIAIRCGHELNRKLVQKIIEQKESSNGR